MLAVPPLTRQTVLVFALERHSTLGTFEGGDGADNSEGFAIAETQTETTRISGPVARDRSSFHWGIL